MRTIALENLYRFSLVVSMIDNLSGPAGQVQRQMNSMMQSVQSFTNASANLAKSGLAMQTFGKEVLEAVLSPVQATFETRRAIGELSSLGVKDLATLEEAAGKFSSTWAGTSKAQFITAAYDIKSGIASLTDEGIAKYTELAGVTATATKATTEEMTSLFATGYGIYKDFYGDLSDIQFAEVFSAGISESVRAFKTSGSGMAQSIQTLGAAATSANVPMEEQFAILGMLQATMSGSEAGTKYRAFLKGVAKAGDELGLAFTDANNQLLSMPQILAGLREKFGETIDAAEAMQLQKAFGTDEAVALINLLYEKTGDLEGNILSLHGAMGQGIDIATKMADTINQEPGQQYIVLTQQIQGLKEEIGTQLLPTVIKWMGKAKETITDISNWVKENQGLVQTIMTLALYFGIGVTALGTFNMFMGVGGMLIGQTAGNVLRLIDLVKMVPGAFAKIPGKIAGGISAIRGGFETLYLHGLYAKDALIKGVLAVKNYAINLLLMGKNAMITGMQAIPALVTSVWSFTTALFANPITWIILGVIALTAALYMLWQNWDSVVSFVNAIWSGAVNFVVESFEWIKNKVSELPLGFQLLLAAIFPIVGVPMLIINNWSSISEFFVGLWTNITGSFQMGIDGIKGFIDGTFQWFHTSGERIMTTFTDGIKSMAMAPVNAVKDALARVRQYLPFSDAKIGPLSTLTLSGKRIFTTIQSGMKQSENLPAQTTEKAFQKMRFRENIPHPAMNKKMTLAMEQTPDPRTTNTMQQFLTKLHHCIEQWIKQSSQNPPQQKMNPKTSLKEDFLSQEKTQAPQSFMTDTIQTLQQKITGWTDRFQHMTFQAFENKPVEPLTIPQALPTFLEQKLTLWMDKVVGAISRQQIISTDSEYQAPMIPPSLEKSNKEDAGWQTMIRHLQSMSMPQVNVSDLPKKETLPTSFQFEVGNQLITKTEQIEEKKIWEEEKQPAKEEAPSNVIIQNQELHFDKIIELMELIQFLSGIKKTAETGGGTLI